MDGVFKCAECSKGGMTEAQAVAHECGVQEPEVVLAEEPVDGMVRLAEAVEGLTYHLAKFVAMWEFQQAGRHEA